MTSDCSKTSWYGWYLNPKSFESKYLFLSSGVLGVEHHLENPSKMALWFGHLRISHGIQRLFRLWLYIDEKNSVLFVSFNYPNHKDVEKHNKNPYRKLWKIPGFSEIQLVWIIDMQAYGSCNFEGMVMGHSIGIFCHPYTNDEPVPHIWKLTRFFLRFLTESPMWVAQKRAGLKWLLQ